MARQKRITKSKIKKIVPQISNVLAEHSSNEDEVELLMSKMEAILDEFVLSDNKEEKQEEDLAGGLSGVVNPRNLGSTGAPQASEGYHIMQKNMSQRADAVNNRGT